MLPPLRIIVDAGNIAHLADDGEIILAGTRDRPGQAVPCNVIDMLGLVQAGLIAGERERLLTSRAGRYFARQGTMAGFDDSVTDVDLAASARGSMDYLSEELFEAVEAYHHEIVLTRQETLAFLIAKGVITPAEAPRDV